MNVSLTPKLEKWVQEKVKTGFYKSSSEVIRDALRVLHLFEEEKEKKLKNLRNDLMIGVEQLNEGKSQKFDQKVTDKIKKLGRQQLNG